MLLHIYTKIQTTYLNAEERATDILYFLVLTHTCCPIRLAVSFKQLAYMKCSQNYPFKDRKAVSLSYTLMKYCTSYVVQVTSLMILRKLKSSNSTRSQITRGRRRWWMLLFRIFFKSFRTDSAIHELDVEEQQAEQNICMSGFPEDLDFTRTEYLGRAWIWICCPSNV